MKFEDYSIASTIKKRLEELGFRRPTDIQFKAIPSILKGEDVLAIAQTGTGKTAAFVIPILELTIRQHKQARRPDSKPALGIQCLVMVPTRELAQQNAAVIQQIAQYTTVKTTLIYGGVDQEPQIKQLKQPTDILVATPGRLFDLTSQGHIKLNQLKVLVLDEADHMLDLGFYKDIQDLVRFLPRSRQTLFFSATINANIKKLAYKLVHNPIRIQLSPRDPVSNNVDHSVALIEMDDKRFFLERIINDHPESKLLVFVRTKVRAERVHKAMARVGLTTETIHGDKDQKQREKALAAFKKGDNRVLIATDVSARGIDIPGVEIVVNYDLPDDKPETYVHRIGRTGRGNSRGTAISFVSQEEQPMLKEIEAFVNRPITVEAISKSDYADTVAHMEDELTGNWRALMEEDARLDEELKQKKKRK